MLREKKLSAIILKKQPFNEADEIITFYTKEEGKVRALAKSIKLAKSKLQGRLQMLFLVNITLAGGKLPKIISAEILEVYEHLRGSAATAKMGFYASELIQKLTADEEKNEALFLAIEIFLNGLNALTLGANVGAGLGRPKSEGGRVKTAPTQAYLETLLANFKISALAAAGFSIIYANPKLQALHTEFKKNNNAEIITELNHRLSEFIEYQLERKLKSEKYLE